MYGLYRNSEIVWYGNAQFILFRLDFSWEHFDDLASHEYFGEMKIFTFSLASESDLPRFGNSKTMLCNVVIKDVYIYILDQVCILRFIE